MEESYETEIENAEVIKEREELLPKEDVPKETIANLQIEKDPSYLYYVDKNGDVVRRKKGTRGKNKKSKIFKEKFKSIQLAYPKILMNSWVSNKFKKVGRASANSGYIWFPKELIGKEFKVILIPKSEWLITKDE